MQDLKSHLIQEDSSLEDALKQLNTLRDSFTLFVSDGNSRVIGTITDGDIRRSLIGGLGVQTLVSEAMNRQFHYFDLENWNNETLKVIRAKKIDLVPFLSAEGVAQTLIDTNKLQSILPVEALIMAGGKGTRLLPLTEHIPKPLLQVGDKAIIEHNVDRLINFGVKHIKVSINHFGDQIVAFFEENKKAATMGFINEDKPLGTLGALGLDSSFKSDYILVMNSDLITTINYERMYELAIQKDADLVVATKPYDVSVPYAVLETSDGRVNKLSEKPTMEYECNAGIYLLHRRNLDLIPKNEVYNATDFIEDLLANDKNVSTYLFREYWLDVGKHNDFNKAQEDIKHLNL